MSKLTYLTVKACQAGGRFWVVQEAVASTALAHPEWDLDVRRSFAEWEDEQVRDSVLRGLAEAHSGKTLRRDDLLVGEDEAS
jgi:hypothetical protein